MSKNAAIRLPGPIPYQLPEGNFAGLAFIGEAPGADEVKQGKPFIGRSGQLLDRVLQTVKLDRSQLLIANVFRYQPPGNKVDHFFSSMRAAKIAGEDLDMDLGKFGSNYVRAQFAGELEQLANILREYQPRAIVTLGRTPLWALTGLNGLLERRGQWQKNRLVPEISVMPTYHPSFIIRGNWNLEPIMVEDIHKALQPKKK